MICPTSAGVASPCPERIHALMANLQRIIVKGLRRSTAQAGDQAAEGRAAQRGVCGAQGHVVAVPQAMGRASSPEEQEKLNRLLAHAPALKAAHMLREVLTLIFDTPLTSGPRLP
jgi:hypothetical protein